MNTGQPLENIPNARVPARYQLRWNLVLFFVMLTVLPMALVMSITLNRAREQAKEQFINQLESVVELKNSEISRWLQDGHATLDLFMASPPRKAKFIAFAAGKLPSEEEHSLNIALQEAVEAQSIFEELFIYNTDGRIVAASNPVLVGRIVTLQPYFASSLARRFVQTPYYEVGRGSLTMLMTHPLLDIQRSQAVGVLAGRYDMTALGQIMTERTGLGESGETYLISLENNYLVTPSRFESEGYVLTRAYHSEGINRALGGETGYGTYASYRDPSETVIGVFRWLPNLQVAMLAEVSESEALAPFVRSRSLGIAVAIGAALVAAVVGLYYASRVSRPIAELTEVAVQIASGNLDRTVDAVRKDETGILAQAFNSMTGQLREMIVGLEQRTRLIENIITSMLDALIILDPELRIQTVNRAALELLGYPEAELIGQPADVVFAAELFGGPGLDLTRTELAKSVESVFRAKDGRQIPILLSGSVMRGEQDQVQGIVCVAHDITRRVRAEETLQFQNALLLTQQEAAIDGILVVDEKGEIISFNRQFANMWGIPSDVLDSRSDERALAWVLDQLLEPEEFLARVRYLYEHRDEKSHERIALADARAFDRYSAPMFGPEGRYYGRVWYFRDITERVRAESEREALIAELEAKNAELERFSYTVSHDLTSPLITIKGFLGFLEQDALAGNVKRMKADIGRISSAADKMHQLLDELLELSRIGRLVNQPQSVPFGELAREALDMVAGRLAERDIEVEILPDLPTIFGDRPRLREVLENLVDNAAKFVGDHPQPRVEIGARRDGDENVFFVRDNGAGIDPRYHDKVFDLFEKLDRETEGSGVGLAIVRRIVEVHGGRIWVESEGTGSGSCFCFTLPATEKSIPPGERA